MYADYFDLSDRNQGALYINITHSSGFATSRHFSLDVRDTPAPFSAPFFKETTTYDDAESSYSQGSLPTLDSVSLPPSDLMATKLPSFGSAVLDPYAPPKFHSPTTNHLPQFTLTHHPMLPLWFNATWSIEYGLREQGMRAGVNMYRLEKHELFRPDDDIRDLFNGEREIQLIINWPGYEHQRRFYWIEPCQDSSRYTLAKKIASLYRLFVDEILATKAKGSIKRYQIGSDDSCGEMLITYSNLYLVGLICIQLDPPLWGAEVATDGVY